MKKLIIGTVILIAALTIYRSLRPHTALKVTFATQEIEKMAAQIAAPQKLIWRTMDGHVIVCGESVCRISGYVPAPELKDEEIEKRPEAIEHWLSVQPKHLDAWRMAITKSERNGGHPEFVVGFVQCRPDGCEMSIPQ